MSLSEEAILYYAEHPVHFVEDLIGVTPDERQAEILNSVADNPMTSVRSGHGVGKSAVEAWAIIWFMATRPFPKIACTAPTQHQLFDILWAEVSKWLRHSPALAREYEWTREKVYLKGYPEEWFAVARTATKPDALQGFHAENILYIIDEASGVKDIIFEPVLGALSTPGARLLMCGNPTQLQGFFYESHTKNRASYNALHIDGRKSGRVSQDFVNTIIRMYGEDSDVFRVRVAGEFPKAESDVFIQLSLVEKSIMTEYSPRKVPNTIRIGCDVARFGDDKTVIGSKVDEKVTIERKRQGQDTMKTADEIVLLYYDLLQKHPDYKDPITVCVDDGGVGGGVVDRLKQIQRNAPDKLGQMNIVPIKFGLRIKHKFYHDSTTFMMATVKALLSPHDEEGNPKPVELILPNDDDLVAQLSGRKYKLTESAKIKVESKDEMKRRNLPSPDEADCVLLLCVPIKQAKKKGENS